MGKNDTEIEAGYWEQYVASGTHAAFRCVVRQWLPLVMGVAMRRSGGQWAMAEDVSQMVFSDLAQRAKSVRGATLGGWLHKHTCFTTAKVMRSEKRRARRERMATEGLENAPGGSMPGGEDGLDDILLGLGESDRQALLLRYVEERSHGEIAAALGISRAAAQKRCERALVRLRQTYRANLTPGAMGALLAPPLSGGFELADRITGSAVQATSGMAASTMISTPLVSGLCGFSVAMMLAVFPLSQVVRELGGARSALAVTRMASRPDGGTPDSLARSSVRGPRIPGAPTFRSAEDGLAALLAIADLHGVGKAGQDRATALAMSFPAEWMHPVLLGFGNRASPGVRGTKWFSEVARCLSARWRPPRVPEDLIAIWPLLPPDPNLKKFLFQGCAVADIRATRRLLEGFDDEQRLGSMGEWKNRYREKLQEAILRYLLDERPAEVAAFFQTLPQRNHWDPDIVGEDELRNVLWQNPATRMILWKSMPTMGGRPRERMALILLGRLPPAEQQNLIESVADPELRAELASRFSSEVLETPSSWLGSLPEGQRPKMAAAWLLHKGQTPDLPTLEEMLDQLGESRGGVEFDILRKAVIKRCRYIENVDSVALVNLANRIKDPADRIVALSEILPQVPQRNGWIQANLTPAEATGIEQILKRPYQPY